MGFDPRLKCILYSDLNSLPHCDGPTSSNGTGIHAIGSAITAAGWPHTAGGTSKIVVLLNNIIDTIGGVVASLPPSAY
jgi:hypothetical protein